MPARQTNSLSSQSASHLTAMKKYKAALHAAQLLTGIAAAAAAYALRSRLNRRTSQQVVLITGGSRGLGLALAERYGRAGAKLILAARDHDELTAARYTLLGPPAGRPPPPPPAPPTPPADLTDTTQATSLIEHAISHFGHIDILINNAGIIE